MRVRNSAILAGISLFVSALYFMNCFTNAYAKGKAMRRAKRHAEMELGTTAQPRTEEKQEAEDEEEEGL